MKKFLTAITLGVLTMLALTGCFQEAPQAEQKQTEQKVETKQPVISTKAIEPVEYTTVKEKIENIDVYGTDFEGALVSNCSKEAEALNAKLKGTIKTAGLTNSGSTSSINVLKSGNSDNLTKEQIETITNPCAELGSNQVLKVTSDYILWGYPKCSGGVATAEGEFGYEDYKACLEVEAELIEYLGN
jgi:hypothetical protein